MQRTTYYITVIFIFSFFGFMGILMFPSEKEQSLMDFYEGNYDASYELLRDNFDRGDHSLSIIMPLIWSELNNGKPNEAAFLMETYVKDNPQDIDAKKYLGKLYSDVNRNYDYLLNLEEVSKVDVTVKTLRELKSEYHRLGMDEEEMQVLIKILDRYPGDEQEYKKLAFMYAYHGDFDKAFKLLEKMFQDVPIGLLSSDIILFAMSLYAEQGEKAKSDLIALMYINEFPVVETAWTLVNFMHMHGNDEIGFTILERLSKEMQDDPDVLNMKFDLYYANGRYQEAYNLLKTQYAKGKLPINLQDDFILLSLTEESDSEETIRNMEKIDFASLSPTVLFSIVEAAITTKTPGLAQIMKQKLGKEYLDEHQFLSIALDLGLSNPSKKEEERLRELHKNWKPSEKEKIELVGLYNERGYRDFAKELMGSIDSLQGVLDETLYQAAGLYVELDMVDVGLKEIGELNKQKLLDDTFVDEAWLLLTVANGNEELAEKLLKEGAITDNQILVDLFYISLNHNEPRLALELAEKLIHENPSVLNSILYATALVLNDHIDEGEKIFIDIKSKNKTVRGPYIKALATVSKDHPEFRDDLQEQIAEEIKDPKLSMKMRRDYGYILVDNEMKEEAAEIFYELSRDKKVVDKDVEELLWIWGDKLDEEQVDWIAERAEDADEENKGGWLKALVNVREYNRVIALVGRDELSNDLIADAYLMAAANLKRKELVADAVNVMLPREERLPRLKEMGVLLYSAEMFNTSEEVFVKALTIDENDPEIYRYLGLVNFAKMNFCMAQYYFNRYFVMVPGDYTSHYDYAEIMAFKKLHLSAFLHYCIALHRINELEVKDTTARSIEAHLYYKLDEVDCALAMLEEVLIENSENNFIRADYANMLIDYEYYRSAKRVLMGWLYPPTVESEDPEEGLGVMDLTWARMLKDTNQTRKAILALRNIVRDRPEDPTAWSLAADVNNYTGHWRRGLRYVNKALEIAPESDIYRQQRDSIVYNHLPFFGLNHEYRVTGLTQFEHFYRVGGTYGKPWNKMFFNGEADRMKVAQVTLINGDVVPFHGNRERYELGYLYDSLDGRKMSGSMYYCKTAFGVSAEYGRAFYNDVVGVRGEYHQPNWDFTEMTVQYGTRDKILYTHAHRFSKQLSGGIIPSLNRYNLHGLPRAGTTWRLEAILTYTLSPWNPLIQFLGTNTNIGVNLTLDKEQKMTLQTKIDAFGNPFNPLPFTNREEYNFFATYSKPFTNWITAEAWGGYTYDRAVGGGMLPIGGMGIILWKEQVVQGRLVYTHTTSTQQANQIVNSWVADLKYIY